MFERKDITESTAFFNVKGEMSHLKKAIMCYGAAAKLGHLDAITDLAYLYEKGKYSNF
jgi:TPR repeat protein